jgi:hypothetical protein
MGKTYNAKVEVNFLDLTINAANSIVSILDAGILKDIQLGLIGAYGGNLPASLQDAVSDETTTEEKYHAAQSYKNNLASKIKSASSLSSTLRGTSRSVSYPKFYYTTRPSLYYFSELLTDEIKFTNAEPSSVALISEPGVELFLAAGLGLEPQKYNLLTLHAKDFKLVDQLNNIDKFLIQRFKDPFISILDANLLQIGVCKKTEPQGQQKYISPAEPKKITLSTSTEENLVFEYLLSIGNKNVLTWQKLTKSALQTVSAGKLIVVRIANAGKYFDDLFLVRV